jgi:hypothetical protein
VISFVTTSQFTAYLLPLFVRNSKPKMHCPFIFVVISVTAALMAAGGDSCLSTKEASAFIDGYTDLITKTQANFNLTLAKKLLAVDYHSSSGGVDYVREKPVHDDLESFSASCPQNSIVEIKAPHDFV